MTECHHIHKNSYVFWVMNNVYAFCCFEQAFAFRNMLSILLSWTIFCYHEQAFVVYVSCCHEQGYIMNMYCTDVYIVIICSNFLNCQTVQVYLYVKLFQLLQTIFLLVCELRQTRFATWGRPGLWPKADQIYDSCQTIPVKWFWCKFVCAKYNQNDVIKHYIMCKNKVKILSQFISQNASFSFNNYMKHYISFIQQQNGTTKPNKPDLINLN